MRGVNLSDVLMMNGSVFHQDERKKEEERRVGKEEVLPDGESLHVTIFNLIVLKNCYIAR